MMGSQHKKKASSSENGDGDANDKLEKTSISLLWYLHQFTNIRQERVHVYKRYTTVYHWDNNCGQ